MEITKEFYDILLIKFNDKLTEKHFVGFSKVNRESDVNQAIDSYNDFDNYIEPLKQKIIQVIGSENFNPDATKVLVMFERDEKTSEILYVFLMQVKKEVSLNKAKDLSNYFYAFEYDDCVIKIQINKDIFYDKNKMS